MLALLDGHRTAEPDEAGARMGISELTPGSLSRTRRPSFAPTPSAYARALRFASVAACRAASSRTGLSSETSHCGPSIRAAAFPVARVIKCPMTSGSLRRIEIVEERHQGRSAGGHIGECVPGESSNTLSVIPRTASSGSERMDASPLTVTVGAEMSRSGSAASIRNIVTDAEVAGDSPG